MLRGRPRQRTDLRFVDPRSAARELWLVILDNSASTRRHGALGQAKGLLAEVLRQVYRQRGQVALLQASGARPSWEWPPGKSSASLRAWVQALGAGGGTPLVEALAEVAPWLAQRRRQHPAERQRVLLITDGRLRSLEGLPRLECPALLVDIESGPVRLGRAPALAAHIGAEYRHIEALAIKADR